MDPPGQVIGLKSSCGIKGIIGLIEGTHISIEMPPLCTEAIYVNRKKFHSLNVLVSLMIELIELKGRKC